MTRTDIGRFKCVLLFSLARRVAYCSSDLIHRVAEFGILRLLRNSRVKSAFSIILMRDFSVKNREKYV